MNYIEKLTKYTANFIDELVCSGLRHVVISPGSRSTPLAVLFAAHKEVKDWLHVDERAAAFFALGMAKETKTPVALVCTSGTAAANYYPAVIEAYYARVPLIILTADRPHELRDIGAPQAMDQIKMYGNFVKKFYEMAPPASDESMLAYVRNRAARAMQIARMDNAGPVHLNFPFQEPLMPNVKLDNLWGKRSGASSAAPFIGKKRLPQEQLHFIAETITGKEKGLLVCGPQADETLIRAIVALSEKLEVPIVADPLSQLRTGSRNKATIITTYDAMFKSETMRQRLKPDYIIRFGAMPISKQYAFYVQEHKDALQFVVDNSDAVREPTNQNSEYIISDGATFCEDLFSVLREKNNRDNWLEKWQKYEHIVREQLAMDKETEITEGSAIAHLLKEVPNQSAVFVANSMPIRDVDIFLGSTDKQLTVHANRGLSGIDGTIATALGVAAVAERHVFLIIGDLSFYHDVTSLLLAKQYNLSLTILLINNDGGGIFSFLPQAEDETYFEQLFGTPLQIDFRPGVEMFGGNYFLTKNKAEWNEALEEAVLAEGLTVIEVQTDRKQNVKWHRNLWDKISQRLIEHEELSEDS